MKPTILFRGPVKTRSGYGSHSRDLLEALYQMNLFDIKIDQKSDPEVVPPSLLNFTFAF